MADDEKQAAESASKNNKERELPEHWKQLQTAIWLIGLAILFWQGWIWPGILVLVAISGVSQAVMGWYVDRQEEEKQAAAALETRKEWLPAKCPNCGGPLSADTVKWTGPSTADCPYCSSNLRSAPQA